MVFLKPVFRQLSTPKRKRFHLLFFLKWRDYGNSPKFGRRGVYVERAYTQTPAQVCGALRGIAYHLVPLQHR
jgi:hypothetical protein